MKLLRAFAVLVAVGLLFGVVATAQGGTKKAPKNAADAGVKEPLFLPASKSGPMPFPRHEVVDAGVEVKPQQVPNPG